MSTMLSDVRKRTLEINLDSVHLHEDKQYEFIGNEAMKNLKIQENKE